MDHLKNVFLQEAEDLLLDLEDSLLGLEQDATNPEAVHTIFRALHTLKGSSGMFGYDKLGVLMHVLENVFDTIRQEELQVPQDVLEVTLLFIDQVRNFLQDPEISNEKNKQHYENLLEKIKKVEGQELTSAISLTASPKETKGPGQNVSVHTYLISFEPSAKVLHNGTNPLYLLEDLSELGHVKIQALYDRIPPIDELKPSDCYVTWEVILATDQSKQDIQDVFLFVEGLADIQISRIGVGDLLQHPHFQDELGKYFTTGKHLDGSVLKALAIEIESQSLEAESPKEPEGIEKYKAKGDASIRVSSSKLDLLMNQISELVTMQARLSMITEEVDHQDLLGVAEDVEKLTRQLRENAFDLCLVPIQHVITRFKRLIRDLSVSLQKDVDFVTEGVGTTLDKNVMEALVDPILHLLRNAMDHGIESKAERVKAKKPERGTITLSAYHAGANVVIEIEDDGAGVDVEQVKQKAMGKGLFQEGRDYSQKECLEVMMAPGFSTAKQITNVSGRGVGLDVVKRKVEQIRGNIAIESEKGKGTKFMLSLPLSLSIIDGLLVEIAETVYLIPFDDIHKIHLIEHQKISKNINGLARLDDKQVPFINLRKEFRLEEYQAQWEYIVEVRYENTTIGLTIDKVRGEFQAVLKPLSDLYLEQDYLSGATMLADGTVALVIDINKIINHFVKKEFLEDGDNNQHSAILSDFSVE